MYFVRHRNPNHEAIIGGNEWAIDGPFDNEVEVNQHLNRCAYAAHGIKYETYTDESNEPIEKPNSRRKGKSTVRTSDD